MWILHILLFLSLMTMLRSEIFRPAQVACYDMLSTAHVNCDFHVFLHEIPLFMNFFVFLNPELSFFTAARGVI